MVTKLSALLPRSVPFQGPARPLEGVKEESRGTTWHLHFWLFDLVVLAFQGWAPIEVCVYERERERWELGREVGREGDVGREEALVWERWEPHGDRSNEGKITFFFYKVEWDYMVWNNDNRKENTGGLMCETLCEQEYTPFWCFAIINQHFNGVVSGNEMTYFTLSHGPLSWLGLLAGNFFLLLLKQKFCQELYRKAWAERGGTKANGLVTRFTICLLFVCWGCCNRNATV